MRLHQHSWRVFSLWPWRDIPALSGIASHAAARPGGSPQGRGPMSDPSPQGKRISMDSRGLRNRIAKSSRSSDHRRQRVCHGPRQAQCHHFRSDPRTTSRFMRTAWSRKLPTSRKKWICPSRWRADGHQRQHVQHHGCRTRRGVAIHPRSDAQERRSDGDQLRHRRESSGRFHGRS